MKRVRHIEHPSSWEVTEALNRVKQATAEHYEMQESANPLERAEKWLGERRLPERIKPIDDAAFKVAMIVLGAFVLWLILRAF